MINKLKSLTLNPPNKIYLNIFFIFIFFLILKLPTFNLAIRGDIETYSIIANNYLTGDLTSLLDNKPPFLYLTYILNIFLSKNDLFLSNLFSSIPILIGSLLILPIMYSFELASTRMKPPILKTLFKNLASCILRCH